jgi:hypothetical protein
VGKTQLGLYVSSNACHNQSQLIDTRGCAKQCKPRVREEQDSERSFIPVEFVLEDDGRIVTQSVDSWAMSAPR